MKSAIVESVENVTMPTDKLSDAIASLGTSLESILVSNGYFNDIVAVSYGVTEYDYNSNKTAEYPRIHIIANNVSLPNFTTTESVTSVPIKVVGYLRKPKDIETGLDSYQKSLNFSWDIRKGIGQWLKDQDITIDADLEDNTIDQTIGFPGTLLTINTEFSIIFNECLLQ